MRACVRACVRELVLVYTINKVCQLCTFQHRLRVCVWVCVCVSEHCVRVCVCVRGRVCVCVAYVGGSRVWRTERACERDSGYFCEWLCAYVSLCLYVRVCVCMCVACVLWRVSERVIGACVCCVCMRVCLCAMGCVRVFCGVWCAVPCVYLSRLCVCVCVWSLFTRLPLCARVCVCVRVVKHTLCVLPRAIRLMKL